MDEVKKKGKIFFGWYILAACWLIILFCQAFPNYGSPVMNAFMAKEFNAKREAMGGMFSVYLALGGIPGVIAGSLMAKYGSKPLLISGAVASVIGALIMALFVTNINVAFWGYGVFIGYAHFAGGFLGTQYVLVHWFRKRRALANAILYSAAGFGGIIAPQILNFIIRQNGNEWRYGWWVMVVTGLLTLGLVIFFVKDKPEEMGLFPDGVASAKEVEEAKEKPHPFRTNIDWSLKQTFATPIYWALLFGFAAPSATYATYLAHGVLHLRDVGFTPEKAAIAISISSTFSLLSKLLVGFLGDRIDPKYIWGFFLCCASFGIFTLANANSDLTMAVGVAGLGSGFGGMIVCMVTVYPNYFGVKVFPILSGISLTLQGSAIALVPTFIGKIYDKTGSYTSSFYALSGACLFMAIIMMFFVKPPKFKGN